MLVPQSISNVLKGDNGVELRLVTVEDAEFILNLRTDPDLNKYLSHTSSDYDAQKQFLKNYKLKEYAKEEFYFKITYNERDVGTVRIYNINYQENTFTWGSWIVKRGNPGLVALSSAYLSYYFAFNILHLNKALIDVRKDNLSVFELYKVYCDYLYEDDLSHYLEFKKSDFSKFFETFKAKLPTTVSH